MSGKALWQNLKDLVDFDKKIFKLKSDIDSTKKSLNDDAAQVSKLKALLESKSRLCFQMQKNVDSFELDSSTFEEEEKAKKAKLDVVRSQKEYKSIEAEVEHARKERMKFENQITEAWYNLENAKKEYEADKVKLIEKEELLVKDMEAKTANIQDLTSKLNGLDEERTTISSSIPADWLIKYERMKNSVEDPIAPVINGSCSACYYSVLQQDYLRLKRSGVLPCRSCYRFLYYDEEEEKASQQAKF
jgi:predicted  nucleic acid-binding Zn-ribbon protein